MPWVFGKMLRFAARLLLKDKWFTLVAAVALALGIGVNATVFTFVNAVLIRGLPIADPDRTMAVDSFDRVAQPRHGRVVPRLPRLEASNTRPSTSFGAYNGTTANVSDEGQPPERFNGITHHRQRVPDPRHRARCSGATSCRTTIGRGAQPVVLIGHGVWQNRYGTNPSRHRPDRPHQRRAGRDHRRDAGRLQVSVQHRSLACRC